MGYAGGSTPSPTYRNLGDHSEVIQIDFDPSILSYTDLLKEFWEGHEAHLPAYSRQYRSVILTDDAGQARLAQHSLQAQEQQRGRSMQTRIEPLQTFTRAENYHQKYYLRQRSSLMRDLLTAYPDERSFGDATLSARLNALAGGYKDEQLMAAILDSPILSEQTRQRLNGFHVRQF